jgi:hypothetical protein
MIKAGQEKLRTETKTGMEEMKATESEANQDTQTQDNGEPLQKFATAIEQLTHCGFPALDEDHVHRGLGKAFSYSTGDRHESAASSGKQENRQRDPQADLLAGSRKANSQIIHRAL